MNGQGLPVAPKKKRSPWVWIGIGCGTVVALCVILVIAAGVVVHSKWKNFTKQFDDPVVRDQRVREALGAKELPPGYYPMMTFSIPWVVDVSMLSDREMVKGELKKPHHRAFDKWGFIYVRTPYSRKSGKFQDYMDGKKNPDELLQNGQVHFHKKDEIGRGVVAMEDGSKLHYTSTRGEVEIGDDMVEGITTLMAVECPEDSKFRLGVWFGPDPTAKAEDQETSANDSGSDADQGEGESSDGEGDSEGTSDGAADTPSSGRASGPAPAVYAGSPADESAIKDFMSHFTLCK